MIDETYFDEETIFKVHRALQSTGLSQAQANDAIVAMQNVGILFRERAK